MFNFGKSDDGEDYIDQITQQFESADGEGDDIKVKLFRLFLFGLTVGLMLYTGYHGINATASLQVDSVFGRIFGYTGVVIVELLFMVISNALIWGVIIGNRTYVYTMAFVCFASFLFIITNVLVDGQINGGLVTENMRWYINFVQPISSAILIAITLFGEYHSPEAIRARQKQIAHDKLLEQAAYLKYNSAIADLDLLARMAEAERRNKSHLVRGVIQNLEKGKGALDGVAQKQAAKKIGRLGALNPEILPIEGAENLGETFPADEYDDSRPF